MVNSVGVGGGGGQTYQFLALFCGGGRPWGGLGAGGARNLASWHAYTHKGVRPRAGAAPRGAAPRLVRTKREVAGARVWGDGQLLALVVGGLRVRLGDRGRFEQWQVGCLHTAPLTSHTCH